MRNFSKKLITIFTAGVMAASVGALAACEVSFTPLDGDFSSGEVVSNGGFVVEKGNYVYFINGVETYTSDNTYGTPVKGALMRIEKSDLAAGNNNAEVVIPSLMVAADYTSGIYIFGDRVYFATPNNVRNTSGVIESEYLDFKSARLDGSDIEHYFNVADNATVYRYAEVEGTVYLVYESDSELHSYNTETDTDTLLAQDVVEYVVDTAASGTPYIYYTMGVTADIDVEGGSLERDYNQVYRVRADVTEETAPYEYTFSEEYLEEHDGEVPYVNLGEIVLDGIGAAYAGSPTQFTHDLTSGVTPLSYAGYTYSLQAYANGGLYFTRTDLAQTGSTGEDGWLYYLSAEELGEGWNSVTGNGADYLDVVAQTTDNAGTAAIFYLDEAGAHHYLYVADGNIFRADVTETGTETTLIARGATDAVLISIDDTSSEDYSYVYYTVSGDSGSDIYRAVYNGTEEDYRTLGYEENAPFRPVQILDIEHAGSWYNFEIVDGTIFFADAEAIGATSYNYIATFSLKNESGAVMDNAELKALNEEYEKIVGEDGLIETSQDNVGENMPNALRYYFFMGQDDDFFYAAAEKYSDYEYEFSNGYLTYDSTAFARNIQEAIDEGKKATYLYNQEEQDYFKDWVENGGGLGEARTRGHFITRIGAMSESDFDTMEAYWSNTLENYSVTEEESGLPAWAWALIGVGIGIVVVGAGLAVFFILRAKKNKEGGDEPKMYVDTTDDRSVDVYADDLAVEETASEDASAGEAVEEPAAPDEEGAEAEETDGDKDLDSDDEAAAHADEEAAPADEEAVPTDEEAAPTGEVAAPTGEAAEEEKN